MAENNTNAPLIETSAVGFTYQGSETPALQDVTLSIGAGECVLLCGKAAAEKPPSPVCSTAWLQRFSPAGCWAVAA